MRTLDQIDRLIVGHDDTLQGQAEYLDELARAIRDLNAWRAGIRSAELEARLDSDFGLGPVPAGLSGQFSQSGPSYSLGNVQSYFGNTNQLPDPAWEGWGTNVVPTTTAKTALSFYWSCRHVLNSGTLPAVHDVNGRYFTRTVQSPLNTDQSVVTVAGFGANACDLDIFVYPTSPYDAGAGGSWPLPYLVAAVRYAHQDATGFGDAAVTVTLQIVENEATAPVVVAESPALNPATLTLYEVFQLAAAVQKTPAQFLATNWTWRLKVHVVKPASAIDQSIELVFGEPQLHFAYTPDAAPFAPVIARWVPKELYREDDNTTSAIIRSRAARTSNDYLVLTGIGDLKWGPGNAGQDARIRRSATKTLTVDDTAGGPVAVQIVGRRVATPKAAQTLAAGTAIVADYEVVQVNSAGNVTITAAPTIADGVDGQMLTVVNTDTADTITLQDQGTLASSNLRLTAATVALGPRQSIQLMYSATIGDWVQIGNRVAVL